MAFSGQCIERTAEFVRHACDREVDSWRHVKVLRHGLFKHDGPEAFVGRRYHKRPPRSCQRKVKGLDPFRASVDQQMSTRPVAFDSAPYFTAFVASSCSASAKF